MKLRPIIIFVALFGLIYGLLLAPWPGWPDTYGTYFRALGSLVFAGDGKHRVVRFNAHKQSEGFSSIDTRIQLGNRDLAQGDGKMPVATLGLDSRGVGWIPTALTIALILSTPVPWKRRAWALLWGLILIQIFILVSIGVYLWAEGQTVSLVVFTPFWKQVADGLEYTLITQYEASFFVPVFVWLLVMFRRDDFAFIKK